MAEIGNLKRENEKSISTISMKMESLLQLKRNEQSEHQVDILIYCLSTISSRHRLKQQHQH